MQSHGHCQLGDIQRWAGFSGEPLFDTLMVVENYPMDEKRLNQQQQGTLQFGQPYSYEFTHYPLTLAVLPGEQLQIVWAYDSTRLAEKQIEQLSQRFQHILFILSDALLTNPSQPLGQLNLLDEQQQEKWQVLSRQTSSDYPWDNSQLFTDLVRRQAMERPHAIALIHGHSDNRQCLSYGELESRSNALANLLIKQFNPQADDIIAVCCERGIDMMIGFIAALKAGAAFLPMDPDYPEDRLAYMLSDSGATLILTQQKLIQKSLLNTTVPQLALDKIDYSQLADSVPKIIIQPQQLAYVIYTSGSTGQPKGVLIPHIGLSMHVQTIGQRYGMTTDDVELLFASISFDGCIERWSVPLAFGSRLVIRDQALWSAEKTCQVLEDEGVTISCLPPSYASALLDWIEFTQSRNGQSDSQTANHRQPNLKVRSWTLGGEAFTRELYQRLQNILKPERLINGYGPTETVITPTLWDAYSDTAIDSAYAPIGTGIGERRLYVLDNDLNPVPHGTSGELYIGEEVGLARGYHRRPDLTAERFLPDPFIAFNIASDMTPENKNSSRMYRTGDRVQWTELADGRTVLDYLGRVDQQIKIRGFRVELGEIEVALHGQPEISDVVVAACETPSGKRLVAYCVLTKKEMERNDGPDWKNISARLAKDLPDYMVPSHYEILKQLPLNPAGKVDRNALPEPDWQPQELIEYSAPETEQEIVLANIWGKLLLQNSQPESKPLRISRHAHFFALGGHSLLATRMVGLLRQRGWQLSLQVLFDQPVLADCALQLVADTDSSAGIELISRSAGQLFPATSIQKRLWFVQQLNPQSSAYHMPMALNIQGQLNLPKLEQALNVLIAEQEILRTNLVQKHGDIFQKIKPQYSLEIESFTYYNEQQLRDYIAQPFDLACDALLRVAVFHSTTEARLILVQHHIISDGVATQLLLQKWLKSYQHLLSNQNLAALNSGLQTTLSDPRQQPQYADFACWQQEWLASDNAQQQLDWWIETLGQDDQTLELATDYRRGERQPGGERIALEFSAKQLESLKQLSQQQDISVFNLLFAPWQSLMHLYTGQNTIRSGVPVAGRTLVDTHEMAGCFINTLVIGADIDTDTSLLSLAQQLAITTASAQAHQDIPFERLVEELVQSAGDRHPLYQVSFNLQYTDSSVLKDWPDANVHLFDPGTSDSQTELALDLYIDGKNPEQQVLRGFIGFDTGLYKTSSITRMANRYLKLLDTLLAQPEQPLHDINILLADEQQSLVKCNQTHKNWGEFVSIPQRIIEQGRRTPNAIAISYSAANNNDNNYQKKQLTYRQFDHRVNGLANLLREQGVTEEVPVIISLPRSLDMVLGIHAITRSGGNYVPLDYELPQERRDCIIDTAQSTLVLTSSALAEHFVATNLTVVCIDQLWQQLAENKPLIEVQPPFVNWQPQQAFYTIFTSGSTGKPKGVINHHGALENRLLWMAREYQIDNNDVLLQKTPFGFDVSVWEFFLPFITGAALAIAPPDAHREASWLRKVMDLHKVTLVHFVPSMLAEYLEAQQLSGQENIKRIICSGEALTTNHQQQVFAQHSHVELHNLYGPTEAAIDVSYWSCQREPQAGIAVPIGQAISNTQLYILDESLQQVPFGMTGELYLAGDNLARGYSQRPDLTADRFMPNPYGAPGSRMYRTGDKALRRIDGAIDYLGRLDHQVKLRGLRIELGEIEQQLNALVEIQQAVVVVDEREQSPQLAAYLVMASESESINNTAIQQRLRQYLPDYMVPNFYMAIDAIPLSANGKRDVRSLPKIEIQQRQYRAPESDIAHKLAEQWELLLKIDNIGLDDSFFALGGHSLLAVRVIAAIRNEWQVDISIRQFFASQSLEEMATLIERQVEQTQSGNEQELDEMAALLDELEGL
jgi:amino acid adenylation domain-containing protein